MRNVTRVASSISNKLSLAEWSESELRRTFGSSLEKDKLTGWTWQTRSVHSERISETRYYFNYYAYKTVVVTNLTRA